MEQGPLEIGSLIDSRHRLNHVLGAGGFATVYLGIDTQSGREVAVKALNQPLLHRARFEREIQAVAQLCDPHTVRLFSHGEAPNGTPYIVFEYVPGRDLKEVLEDTVRLAPHVVEHILRQLLMSLAEAHRAGVIHRDLKPANIRIFTHDDDPWRVKLLDFGIAGFEKPQDAKLTKTGELVGTPKYMSPEQLTGSKVGPSGDIYSLGMVALEMIVGLDEMHGSRWSDQIERLQTGHLFAVGSSHAHLDRVLAKMTARNPLHRFQSAEAVLSALDNPALLPPKPEPKRAPDLGHESTSAESQTRRPAAPSSGSRPAPAREEKADKDTRLSIMIATVALAALVIGTFVIRSVVFEDDEPAPPPAPRRSLGAMVVGGEPREPEPVPDPAPDAARVDPRPKWAQVDPAGSGCGMQRVPSGISNRRVGIPGTFGTQLRDYLVRVPRGYDPNRPYPVWLLFHTVVFEAHEFIAMAALEDFADEHGIILLGFSKRDVMQMFEDADKALVAGALAATIEDLCVDRERVFGFSHGKGGNFARKVACDLELAAIATIGDWAQRGPHCDEPIPYIRFSGTEDTYSRPQAGGMNCVGEGPLLAHAQIEAAWKAHNECSGDAIPWGDRRTSKRCPTSTCTTPYVTCEYPGGHFFPRGKLDLLLDPCDSEQPDFPIVDVARQFFDTIAPERVGE